LAKSSILWTIMPRSLLKINGRFGGTCRLRLKSRRISLTTNQHKSSSKQSSTCYLFHGDSLLGSFFDTEDGGEIFLRNVGLFFTKWRRYIS
jgi:hypothetical protein